MGNKMNSGAFVDFYILQEIRAKAEKESSWNAHAISLFERVNDALGYLSANLASACRDYIFMAAIGEARHAKNKCSIHIPGIPGFASKEAVYEYARTLAPSARNIARLVSLFRDGEWTKEFGGESWAEVVELLYQYDHLPPGVFVDAAVDLQHNCGNIFDKYFTENFLDFRFSMTSLMLQRFLDEKRRESAIKAAHELKPNYIPHPLVRDMARKAASLWLDDFPKLEVTDHRFATPSCHTYLGVEWGEEELCEPRSYYSVPSSIAIGFTSVSATTYYTKLSSYDWKLVNATSTLGEEE